MSRRRVVERFELGPRLVTYCFECAICDLEVLASGPQVVEEPAVAVSGSRSVHSSASDLVDGREMLVHPKGGSAPVPM